MQSLPAKHNFQLMSAIFNIVLGGYSWNDKFQRADFYKTFIEFAKKNPSKFESQFVIIERDMKPSIRSYEYNYL